RSARACHAEHRPPRAGIKNSRKLLAVEHHGKLDVIALAQPEGEIHIVVGPIHDPALAVILRNEVEFSFVEVEIEILEIVGAQYAVDPGPELRHHHELTVWSAHRTKQHFVDRDEAFDLLARHVIDLMRPYRPFVKSELLNERSADSAEHSCR